MNFWMKDITNVFSERSLTKGYYYKTQRILYSKDSITYYKIWGHNEDYFYSYLQKELQLSYSFALRIVSNFKPC